MTLEWVNLVNIRRVLGPDAHDMKENILLNRAITWNDDSIDTKADPGHADLVIRELGLCVTSQESTIPGRNIEGDQEQCMLDKVTTTKSTSVEARLNYMVSVRANLQYSVKELCRGVSAPTNVSLRMQKEGWQVLEGKAQTQDKPRTSVRDEPHCHLHRHQLGWLSPHSQVNEWRLCDERQAHDQDVEQHTGHHCALPSTTKSLR